MYMGEEPMGKQTGGRRGFLKTIAAAGGTASTGLTAPPERESSPERKAPAAAPAHPPVLYPRKFTGRQLAMLAFPLGGVAAGTISLGGRGQLRDWEIFNRSDKGRSPSYAFPAIWVQAGSKKPVARVLEARFTPPYEAAKGLGPNNAAGLRRFTRTTFTGEYPMANLTFEDARVPVKVSLEAFTPFIPLDAEESGLPVTILRYRVANPGPAPAKVAIAFSLDNFIGPDKGPMGRSVPDKRTNEYREAGSLSGLFLTNPSLAAADPMQGSFALCLRNTSGGKVTYLRGWPRAKWWASPLLFWDDFTADGELGPEAANLSSVGALCLTREIAAGAEAVFEFVLAWHFPNRTPARCGWNAPKGEEETIIGNHYCERFPDAWSAAAYAAANLPSLEKRTRQFLAAMRATTLPGAVKEAAMANLSTLVTQTCFRTADGKFYGFEGVNDQRGCCFGNCTHVWNYESATHHLFPSIARSMRESVFDLAAALDGQMPMRIQLPAGRQTGGTAAADGAMGQIMKAYLDWRLSGDDVWLRALWPKIRKTLEFAWIAGGWDADKDGVMEGVQHNTYDVEFFGPNPMCGIYYLGALLAGERMATAAGDTSAAAEYRRLFENGSKWIDRNLFNGEYYIQKTQGVARDKIAKDLVSGMGGEDTEHPEFQVAEGCQVDQLVGQYVAFFSGLGMLTDPAHIRATMASIYRYNYRRTLEDHDSVQRIFALNDESALVVCDYAKAPRPKVPFPYFAEVWTGLEYTAASLMFYMGMHKEGLECIENIRRRYDGERRNPWDEAECGHHYARAMAAWSGVLALSGFQYDGRDKSAVALPLTQAAEFTSFWSAAAAWGTFTRSAQNGKVRLRLAVLAGALPLRTIEFAAPEAAALAKLGRRSLPHDVARTKGRVRFTLREQIEIAAGEELILG
jgi:non-lysosomal glucosylceramidase